MTKRALPAILAFLSLCLALPAQANRLDQAGLQTHQADIFGGLESAALIRGLPGLTLADSRNFSLSSAWVNVGLGPFDLGPGLAATELPQMSAPQPASRTFSPGRVPELHSNSDYYVGGEVGFLYGRSSGGKSSLEEKSTYIIGEVGNDKVHITVGASYDEVNGRVPRFGR